MDKNREKPESIKSAKQDEKLLRSVRELADLKFALDESAIVAVTDQTGKITYVNDKFCEISKYSREELLGQDHRIINSSYHSNEFIRNIWITIANGRTWHGELRNRAKDGSIYWVDTTIVPYLDQLGKPYQYVAVRYDITERKRSEEKIRDQAALLDTAQDAIFVRGVAGTILYWNKSAEKLYGWPADDVLGKSFDAGLFGATPQLDGILEAVLENRAWSGEMRQFTNDGKALVVESRWTLVLDDRDRPRSFLVTNTDLTHGKQIEAQFLRSQRMESIGTLAGGIAHDLNNVLSPMLLSVQVLQRKHTDEESQRWLLALRENAERGAALIKQLLSFARGTETDRIPLQPRHLVKEVIRILRDTLPKSVNIRFFLPDNLWTVAADPTQIHQVLMNLCVNARDAMPRGGVLTLKVENLLIDESYVSMNPKARCGKFVLISIGDNGEGIPPESLDRIFEPFFTTKEVGKGTGLGLSTAAGIVNSHGGFINVSSRPGHGSRFEVYLPAIQTEETQTEEAVTFELPEGSGESILVVDDEKAVRTITQMTLEKFNYRVITAANGAEAVAVYRKRKDDIALVITDMMMPVMDGAELVSSLVEINPGVLVVSASGLLEANETDQTRSSAVKAYLPKPFTAETLLKTLAQVLGKS